MKKSHAPGAGSGSLHLRAQCVSLVVDSQKRWGMAIAVEACICPMLYSVPGAHWLHFREQILDGRLVVGVSSCNLEPAIGKAL
jgi:hypothetical protein